MSAPINSSAARSAEASSNAIFDRLAGSYGYTVDANAGARLKYELVLRHLSPDARVLDVGCGNGLHMRKIAPHCRGIVGVDINARMLELAEEALRNDGVENADLGQMSASDLHFEPESFDLVYSIGTLLLIPEAEKAIAEISRVVRISGIVILDITGRRNLSQRHWNKWYRSQGHPGLRSYRWREARAVLAGAGLEMLQAPALGLLDQWRYLPGLRRATFLERVVHRSLDSDLDLAVSNVPFLRGLANRWYFVCRKLP